MRSFSMLSDGRRLARPMRRTDVKRCFSKNGTELCSVIHEGASRYSTVLFVPTYVYCSFHGRL